MDMSAFGVTFPTYWTGLVVSPLKKGNLSKTHVGTHTHMYTHTHTHIWKWGGGIQVITITSWRVSEDTLVQNRRGFGGGRPGWQHRPSLFQ